MKKAYPRARVSRHATLNGWVIDLIQREGGKPKRVAATYSTIPWAYRAALTKLGIKIPPAAPPGTAHAKAPESSPGLEVSHRPALGPGTCHKCERPMRRQGTKATDHPGTVLRQREGLCQSCCKKEGT